jgi:hypothetical protein
MGRSLASTKWINSTADSPDSGNINIVQILFRSTEKFYSSHSIAACVFIFLYFFTFLFLVLQLFVFLSHFVSSPVIHVADCWSDGSAVTVWFLDQAFDNLIAVVNELQTISCSCMDLTSLPVIPSMMFVCSPVRAIFRARNICMTLDYEESLYTFHTEYVCNVTWHTEILARESWLKVVILWIMCRDPSLKDRIYSSANRQVSARWHIRRSRWYSYKCLGYIHERYVDTWILITSWSTLFLDTIAAPELV